MVVAAARRPDRRPAGEGKAIMGRGAVNQKGPETAFLSALHAFKATGRQAAGQPGAGRRGRGGDRLAQLPPDRRHAGSPRGAGEGGRNLHSVGAGQESTGATLDRPRRQGRGRAPADFERREMGTRAQQGHPLEPAWPSSTARPGDWSRRSTPWSPEDGHTPAVDGWFENVKPLTARQKELIADDVAAEQRSRDQDSSSASSTGSRTRIS